MTYPHESIDVDLDEPGILRIRYVRVRNGVDNGGQLVLDRANAAWLADQLKALADDSQRPETCHRVGDDQLEASGSGREHAPYGFVNVLNDRTAAPVGTGDWSITLTQPYARQLAQLLRHGRPPHPLVTSLRAWGERVCTAASSSALDLAEAFADAVDSPPPGVARITVEDGEAGFGTVVAHLLPDALRRADIEALLGPGVPLPPAHPSGPWHHAHEVELGYGPRRCHVFAAYADAGDDRALHVELQPAAFGPRRPFVAPAHDPPTDPAGAEAPLTEHESLDVDLDEPGLVRIRYLRVRNGYDNGGQLVLDRANAAWLADELEALAADPSHPRALLRRGDDHLGAYASGRPPYIVIMSDRRSAATAAAYWTVMLTPTYARRLAEQLREPAPRTSLARCLRRWAEQLCQVRSPSEEELAAAIDGALDRPPAGVARIALDDRVLGLGGVEVDVDRGALRPTDLAQLFGPTDPARSSPTFWVRPPLAPLRCRVTVGGGAGGDDVRLVELRPERLPVPRFVPSEPIEHESVDLDLDDPTVIRIRHVKITKGIDHGGELVVDRANASWLAAELDACAQDDQRPQGARAAGDDVLTVYGGGHTMAPIVMVTNDRRAAPTWARVWGVRLSAPTAYRLVDALRDDRPARTLASTLRRWAEQLCAVASTAPDELTAALDGSVDEPPRGVARISLDRRDLGLGGAYVEIAPEALRQADVDEAFGAALSEVPPGHPHGQRYRLHEVRAPGALLRCHVSVRYGYDPVDDVVATVFLRPEKQRPPGPADAPRHEAADIDLDEPDVVAIRHRHVLQGQEQGGRLAVDRANLAWLAGELDAFAGDALRAPTRRRAGADDITVFGSGQEIAPFGYVTVVNDRRAAPTWAGEWSITASQPFAARLAHRLRHGTPHRPLLLAIRAWAEGLAAAGSTAAADLAAVLGGAADHPPAGVARIVLDERPAGLGGVHLDLEPGAAARADVEEAFGTGRLVPRLDPSSEPDRSYELPSADGNRTCSLFLRYGTDEGVDELRRVRLRVDARPAEASADVDLDGDLVWIRPREAGGGPAGRLVLDRPNATWLADALAALAAEPDRLPARRTAGGDHLRITGSALGLEVRNDRRGAPVWAREWCASVTLEWGEELARLLLEGPAGPPG